MTAMAVRDHGAARRSAARDVADRGVRTTTLASEHVVEVDRALRAVRAAGWPLLSVGPDRFPLPTLGRELRRLAEDLDSRAGFCVVRSLPTDGHGPSDRRLVLWGLGQHLGVPVPQDAAGRMLRTIDPDGADFQTGGSDVVALMPLAEGCTVSLVSAGEVYVEVLRRRPDLAPRLFEPFHLDRRGDQQPGEAPYRLVPLASWSDGRLSLRHDRAAVEAGHAYPGAPRLSRDELALLDLVDEVAASPALRRDVRLHPTDVLLVNNHEVLHRIPASDPASPSGAGLLRLWLTLRQGRRLPAGYTWPTPAYGGAEGRGGVTPSDLIERAGRPPELAHH